MAIKASFYFLSQSAYFSKCTTIFYVLNIHLQSSHILKGLSCLKSNAGVLHFEINRFKSINTHFIITVNASSLASTIISLTNKLLFTERNQQNCYIRPKYIYQWQRSYIMVIQVNKEHLDYICILGMEQQLKAVKEDRLIGWPINTNRYWDQSLQACAHKAD